jgi:hypothetical protein
VSLYLIAHGFPLLADGVRHYMVVTAHAVSTETIELFWVLVLRLETMLSQLFFL